MDQVQEHKHTGLDSPRINGKDLLNAPQAAVTFVAGSPGGTYDAATIATINQTKTAINDLITKLRALGLII